MENEILFTETQKFRQWWIWLMLLGVNGIHLFGIFKQVIRGEQFGDHPMSSTALIISVAVTFLISLFILNVRLETILKKDGIYVRFFPFHIKFKNYSWDTITRSYIRKYSALSDYGGWGVRIGTFEKGTAFNVSGNKGLQLEFGNNNKLLIGTNKPEELLTVLNSIGSQDQ